tara:strand:+ start:331 stop:453 length:123 start_codon:yes stop_codon:yes gene_type:complete
MNKTVTKEIIKTLKQVINSLSSLLWLIEDVNKREQYKKRS